MQGIVISTTSGWKSSRRIFENMKDEDALLEQRVEIGGKSITKRFVDADFTKFKELNGFKYPQDVIIIRYGTTAEVHCDKKYIIYNQAKAIELASNKKAARIVLGKAGIAVPAIIEDSNPKGIYPIIARKSFHERGEDLHIIRDADGYQLACEAGYNYFSELYSRTREFRVHCAHGKVLLIHEKPMPKDPSNIKECINMFNNEDWIYVNWGDYDAEICKIALKATKALGLDFAGVDVMAFPSNKKDAPYVICEVNTAPTLYSYGSSRYAMYFDWLCGSDKPREHVDFTKLTKGSTFAWREKEFQV